MIAIVELKKHIAIACIFSIIVSKFNHKKELNLIILLVVNKVPEVGFYYMILSLIFAVNLRIKGGKEFLLNFEEIIKRKPEF